MAISYSSEQENRRLRNLSPGTRAAFSGLILSIGGPAHLGRTGLGQKGDYASHKDDEELKKAKNERILLEQRVLEAMRQRTLRAQWKLTHPRKSSDAALLKSLDEKIFQKPSHSHHAGASFAQLSAPNDDVFQNAPHLSESFGGKSKNAATFESRSQPAAPLSLTSAYALTTGLNEKYGSAINMPSFIMSANG